MSFVYKIKSTKTGLYSKGGMCPSFTKKGKAWTNIGYLKNHINALDGYGRSIYKEHDVTIECYEVIKTEQNVFTKTFSEFVDEIKQARNDKKIVEDEKIRIRVENFRRQEYEKLKREFEPDTTDIPEITDWSNAIVGRFYTK